MILKLLIFITGSPGFSISNSFTSEILMHPWKIPSYVDATVGFDPHWATKPHHQGLLQWPAVHGKCPGELMTYPIHILLLGYGKCCHHWAISGKRTALPSLGHSISGQSLSASMKNCQDCRWISLCIYAWLLSNNTSSNDCFAGSVVVKKMYFLEKFCLQFVSSLFLFFRTVFSCTIGMSNNRKYTAVMKWCTATTAIVKRKSSTVDIWCVFLDGWWPTINYA